MSNSAKYLNPEQEYIRWFNDISIEHIPIVGGKNAGLGEMYKSLVAKGIRVPNGFAVTSYAYQAFMKENQLYSKIQDILEALNIQDFESLSKCGHECRDLIMCAQLPSTVSQAIVNAYRSLVSEKLSAVAVRSSATAEDLPSASFAGLQETFLNIGDEQSLLKACKKCFASLFTDRAISYRTERKFDHLAISLSIGIQEMVRSDLATSGVMFTIDTETGFRNIVLINSAYGLGENIVKGVIDPDEFHVFKPTLTAGHAAILKRSIGSKESKLILGEKDSGVQNVKVEIAERQRQSISDSEVLSLAKWACIIEEHFSEHAGHFCPMDIEWAKDGISGELFILQARPETVYSQHEISEIEQYEINTVDKPILTGASIGNTIAQGIVRIIHSSDELKFIQSGEILVASKTEPDWEPVMKKAAGIVTDHGGRTCHAAIVSREIGIPAIVGTEEATTKLATGQMITLSCASGEHGYIYNGKIPYKKTVTVLKDLPHPKTNLMINIADPARAFGLSLLPIQGVGLLRMEFIISSEISIHPMALIELEKVACDERIKIDELTARFANKSMYFIQKLAEGIGTIAAAFFPREVIVRFSDFKTNEYANLLGGSSFEPKEENPMLGFRGASRYYHPAYKKGFALECSAIKMVREEMGLTNVKVMIPFCRTIEEGCKVLKEMATNNLVQGENGLEVYVMCEIPSNVILAEQFAELFDGFSIGSNDLTQLILGLDRDSDILSSLFDERNAAVTSMISSVIQEAHKHGKKVGICGQAPSDYPDFAKFLVKNKIDSISLNPDVVLKTLYIVNNAEQERDEGCIL